MDLQSRRCGCGSVFRLATLMSRETRCHACQRMEAAAAMEARKEEAALPLSGMIGGGVRRDVCATGVVKPKPVRWTDSVGGITAIRFPEGIPGPSIVTLAAAGPHDAPLDATCEWRDERGRVRRVEWRAVGKQRRNDGLTWAEGSCTADMPDGRVLCARITTGYVFGHEWRLLTGSIAASNHEQARARALAKWLELRQPEQTPGERANVGDVVVWRHKGAAPAHMLGVDLVGKVLLAPSNWAGEQQLVVLQGDGARFIIPAKWVVSTP